MTTHKLDTRSVQDIAKELLDTTPGLDIGQAYQTAAMIYQRSIEALHAAEIHAAEECAKVRALEDSGHHRWCGVLCSGLRTEEVKTAGGTKTIVVSPNRCSRAVAAENGIGVEEAHLSEWNGHPFYFPQSLWMFLVGEKPIQFTMKESAGVLAVLEKIGAEAFAEAFASVGGPDAMATYQAERLRLIADGKAVARPPAKSKAKS